MHGSATNPNAREIAPGARAHFGRTLHIRAYAIITHDDNTHRKTSSALSAWPQNGSANADGRRSPTSQKESRDITRRVPYNSVINACKTSLPATSTSQTQAHNALCASSTALTSLGRFEQPRALLAGSGALNSLGRFEQPRAL